MGFAGLPVFSGSQAQESRLSLPMRPNLIRPVFLASQIIIYPAGHLMDFACVVACSVVTSFSAFDAHPPSRSIKATATYAVTKYFNRREFMSPSPIEHKV
jgi:hypothetical protein